LLQMGDKAIHQCGKGLRRGFRDLHSALLNDNFFEFIVSIFHEVTLLFTRPDLAPLERFRSPNGLTAAEFPDSSGWPERTPRLVQV